MKSSEFKRLVKESVKEAIQEELKEILLEAVKSSNNVSSQPHQVMESKSPSNVNIEDKRKAYADILGETAKGFTTKDVSSFQPKPGYDVANGTLPSGEVDMSQIMGLMNKK